MDLLAQFGALVRVCFVCASESSDGRAVFGGCLLVKPVLPRRIQISTFSWDSRARTNILTPSEKKTRTSSGVRLAALETRSVAELSDAPLFRQAAQSIPGHHRIMPVSSQREVRALYDDTAEDYDRMMDDEIKSPLYSEVLGGLAERIRLLKGAVVDTSCGSGHMLAELAEEYAPGRELIGIDLSPGMVAIAGKRLGAAATVYEGDMAHLPPEIAAGGCAAVISFFSLHHIAPDELAPCIVEWRRVLTSGGRLVLATWEGEGAIDYGGQSDIVTRRYREAELVAAVHVAGFAIDQHSANAVEGMEMDAVHLSATKLG